MTRCPRCREALTLEEVAALAIAAVADEVAAHADGDGPAKPKPGGKQSQPATASDPQPANPDVERRVLDLVTEHGPLSGRAIVTQAGRKHTDTWNAIKTLSDADRIHKGPKGWETPATPAALPQRPEAPQTTQGSAQDVKASRPEPRTAPYGDRTCPECDGLLVDVAGALVCFACINRRGKS